MIVFPVSEILPVSGVDFVGYPADIQLVQIFAAALVKGAKDSRQLNGSSHSSRRKRQHLQLRRRGSAP